MIHWERRNRIFGTMGLGYFACLMATTVFVFLLYGCGEAPHPDTQSEHTEAEPREVPTTESADDNIQQRVIVVVAATLEKKPDKLDANARLMEDEIGANELDIMEIVMALEDEFQMIVPEDRYIKEGAPGALGISDDITIAGLVEIVKEILAAQKK